MLEYIGDVLTLRRLGKISDKAKKGWSYQKFNQRTESGSYRKAPGLKAYMPVRWEIWVTFDNLPRNRNLVFPNKEEFVQWLEDCADVIEQDLIEGE